MRSEKASHNGGAITASEMGRKRWAGVSPGERKEALAKARAKIKLTKAERSEIGRKAVNARWAKARAAKRTDKPGQTKKRKARKGGSDTPSS